MLDELDNVTKSEFHSNAGIWLLASRINHSCLGNCYRSFIGDMQIVRATRDIPAGTELVFSYRLPEASQSYEETQKNLASWGFTCDCDLCTEKKSTSMQMLQKRESLSENVRHILSLTSLKTSHKISKVHRNLKQLEETYEANNPNRVRMELWEAYLRLAVVYRCAGREVDAIKTIVQSLEALGFVIIASPPDGGAMDPQLEVKRWGEVNSVVPWAFLLMCQAYETLCLPLLPAAKQYFETAYTMVYGEGETAAEEFWKHM